jgi:hypothetical protein
LVPCGRSGRVLWAGVTGRIAWRATLAAACLDAAAGVGWPSSSPWNDPRRRRTQGRRLGLLGRILGIHPEIDESTRERIATRLGVATLRLRDAARSWLRGWQARGAAVIAVLAALSLNGAFLDRLLAAGAVAGVWGPPWRWDVARGLWIGPRSGGAERPGFSSARTRDPPATNSHAAERADPDLSSRP